MENVVSSWDWVPIKKTTWGRLNECQIEHYIVTVRLIGISTWV